jgi:predicted Co/Zn/Cd cation transporter (cation efflux family)
MLGVIVRGAIAVFLLYLAVQQLQAGRPLYAAVDVIFAMVAGLLAFSAWPGAARRPTRLIRGLVAVGVVLWIASLVGRFV